jgi:hypothetical protein
MRVPFCLVIKTKKWVNPKVTGTFDASVTDNVCIRKPSREGKTWQSKKLRASCGTGAPGRKT